MGDRDPDAEEVLVELAGLVETGVLERARLLFFHEIVGDPRAERDSLTPASNGPTRVEAVHTVVREERDRQIYEVEGTNRVNEFEATKVEAFDHAPGAARGARDSSLPRAVSETRRDAFPTSRSAVVAGEAHAAMGTAPEPFVDTVIAFIRERR